MNKKLKPIPGFPDYFIDKQSNVYSMKPCGGNNGIGAKPPDNPRLLSKNYVGQSNMRYYAVSLRKNHKRYSRKISTIMLETFVSPRPKGMWVGHGPKGSLVDTLDNLYWVTPTQNALDKIRDGTMTNGGKNGMSELNELQVRVIRRAYSPRNGDGVNSVQLAHVFNVAESTILAVTNRVTWKHLKSYD